MENHTGRLCVNTKIQSCMTCVQAKAYQIKENDESDEDDGGDDEVDDDMNVILHPAARLS